MIEPRKLALFAAPLLACAATAACTTVGPDYVAPEPQVADGWLESADQGAIEPAWWGQFGDPQLVSLIEQALAGSPDLAEARARLAEARANRDAVFGQTLPQASASGTASENRITENGQIPVGNIPGFEPRFSLFDLGFDASWELDLWGRRTRALEGADARVEAAEAMLDGVLVSLTAEIARNYFELRSAQGALISATASEEALGELARLTHLRHVAGESSEMEARQAAADAAAASGPVAAAETRVSAAAFRLAALLGQAPEDIVPQLREAAPIPDAPEEILVGIRSDLLRRRPDVRRAERELAAATADVGLETASLFPRFSLIGGIGLQSRYGDTLLDGDSLRFGVGPAFAWPIFSGGTLSAQVRAADARFDAAAARYDGAVAGALADSEAAINRYLNARRAAEAATRSRAEQAAAFALAQQRFDSGVDSRLALERARLAEIDSIGRLARARTEAAQAAAALFKALGGAWMAGEA